MEATTSTVRGTRLIQSGRRPMTRDEERLCPIKGCTTKLSRYNRAATCFAHRPLRYPRVRGTGAGYADG